MRPSIVLVEITSSGVAVAVRVNGVPVLETIDGAPRVARRAVSAEVAAGPNLLEVDVRPGEPLDGPGGDEAPDPQQVTVRLDRLADHDAPRSSALVLEVAWDQEQCALPAPGPLRLVRHRFGGDDPAGGAPWREADRLDAAARSALVGFVVELHQALGERAVDRAVALLRGATHGRAAADRADAEREARALTDELESVVDDPAFAMLPLHLPSLVIETIRGGRLAAVRDEAGRPALRARQTRGWWTRTPVLSIAAGEVTAWR